MAGKGSNVDSFRNLGVKRVRVHRGDGGIEQSLGGVNRIGNEAVVSVFEDVENDDTGNGVDQSPESGEEGESLPESEAVTARPGLKSVKPSNFMNASPFQKKTKKTDPASMALLCLCILAVIAAAGAFAVVSQMAVN
jgi:hypothetical protein